MEQGLVAARDWWAADQDQVDLADQVLRILERSLERAEQLFLWGHWDAVRFQAERQRLEALREELRGATEPQPKIQLRGLLDAWDLGDAIARREMLRALFDWLHVSGGEIVGYSARADRQSQVLRLMEALRRRVLTVGGDGSPTPLTDSLRLIV
jgi:hypothetical protein